MFRKKQNKNSEQNLDFVKENRPDENRRRKNKFDDFEFGSDYGDNFFTSDYERQSYYRETGRDDVNVEFGKEDCCKEK